MSSKIWFIGTGKFAALCLENFIRKNIPLHRIITGLPTRSGRNNRENPSAVEAAASALGLTVERTGKLSENQEIIRELYDDDPAIIFVIDFGQIVREPFLSRMCLNIHPSLLPEYRGAAPIQRALLDGKNYTGVSVFRLAAAMDAGGIFGQVRTEIRPDENASELYIRLAEMGCEIAAEAVKNIDSISFTPQDDSKATYAQKIAKPEFELLFTMSAKKFTDTVRALDMSGGAFAVIRGKRVKIWRALLREDIRAKFHGQFLDCSGNPVIACADFGVELAEVQSEGKKIVSGAEWMRGLRLKQGDIL